MVLWIANWFLMRSLGSNCSALYQKTPKLKILTMKNHHEINVFGCPGSSRDVWQS